jgi:FkbM family methyltransferase
MSFYLRNCLNYVNEFGTLCALSLIWQRKWNIALMRLRPRGVKHPLLCRGNDSDFSVLRQIIGKREVAFSLRNAPERIIDGGANVGYSSVLFANLWPKSQIVAVEPDDKNFDMLLRNTAPYPNIKCLRAAIWHREEPVSIANPDASSFEFRVKGTESSVSTIDGKTIDNIMAIAGFEAVDLLKLDIEGAEYDLFEAGEPAWLKDVEYLALELHDRLRHGCSELIYKRMSQRTHSKQGEYDLFHRSIPSMRPSP